MNAETSDIQFELASWNRLLTRDLAISPGLVGFFHKFSFEGRTVVINLPGTEKLPNEPNQGDLLSFNGWRETEGKKMPLYYWVHSVDITVSLPSAVALTPEILNNPPNAYEIVSKSKQEKLDLLAKDSAPLTRRAFNLWLRVLRWKSNYGAIGRPEFRGQGSGRGIHLITESSGQRIWIWHDAFRSRGATPITPEIWKAAELALLNQLIPPVYTELMFDAIEHMGLGDLQRALVDMAVACETYLRKIIADSLPTGIIDSMTEYIDDANIRKVLTKFVPDLINEKQKRNLKNIKSTLHQLFDKRNDILHSGKVEDLTITECEKYLEATKRLFQLIA